ncbi:MAG: ADP-ribose-binding protein [Sulfolobus sp.]
MKIIYVYSLKNGLTVEVIKGDITEENVDAIVNAANSYLQHGGGVAWAIVKKGGEEIQRESDEYVRKYGPIPTGGVAVTRAGKLKAKYIIHAVGPRYGVEGEDKLELAIKNSLLKADELGLESIAIPAISTGIYGYPYEICAKVMARVLKNYAPKTLKKVRVVLYIQDAYDVFKNVFDNEL